MKKIFLLGMFLLISDHAVDAHETYYQEFKTFSTERKTIFDQHADAGMSAIQRDIENYKELSQFQRLVRFIFFLFDVVVITPKTMPTLYSYIDTMCKTQDIQTPTIFITRQMGFFNAAAQKLLMSSGAIIIGQDIICEASDDELEAIVAHEIGHIKHNHVNKSFAIAIGSVFLSHYLVSKIMYKHPYLASALLISGPTLFIRLFIGKRFEQEADEFAYKNMGKGNGLIKFFERLLHMEKERNDEFDATHTYLEDSRKELALLDYSELKLRYCMHKAGKIFSDAFKWFYYNTPYGAHPSPQDRIKTIQEYLAATETE